MNRLYVSLICALVSVSSSRLMAASPEGFGDARAAGGSASSAAAPKVSEFPSPLSRLAIGAGISANGINLQAATNLSKNFNVRGVGNVLKYTLNNFTTQGFTGSASLNLATAGVSLDYYPFPTHAFRLSPGVLFYNQNGLSGTAVASSGQSITLNNVQYYSSASQPLQGVGSLKLNGTNPAFTATLGFGNMIPRNGGHWSFPFELGVAFVGSPVLTASVSGLACANSNGTNCVNAATDPTVQSNLKAQIASSQNDVNALKFYPVLSFGVGYSFRIR